MKRIASAIICLILLISLAVPASAATASPFMMPDYDVGTEHVFFYGKPLPDDGYLEVSVGADVIADSVLSTVGDQKFPLTLYCLVDCNKNISDGNAKQRRDILLTISSLMKPEDTMILGSIDSKLEESKPLTDKELRDNAIRTISGYSWKTNLLDGISKALDNLLVTPSHNTNRSLIIISDGHDDGDSTATKENILKKIEGSGISVYTVLLDSGSTTDKDIKRYKQFAEASLCGFMTDPKKEKVSSSVTGEKIWDNINATTLIAVPVNALAASGADSQVLFRYTTQTERYEDTVLVRAVDLSSVDTEQVPDDTAPTLSTEEDEEDDEDEKKSKDSDFELTTEMMLGIGFGVILLGIGAAAFFILRKKPETTAYPPQDMPITASVDGFDSGNDFSITQKTDYAGSDVGFDSGFNPGFDSGSFGAPVFEGSGSGVTMPIMDRCHVSAVALMHPEVSADFYLTPNMETSFGRTGNADIILNGNDKKLSSCHGSFLWDGKMLLVQDRNSTNGTAVNGEVCPKNVWLRLEDGAVLTAGKYEYRITFKVETH